MSNIQYSNRHDKDFIFELAKIGRVRVLSEQISVAGESIDFSRLSVPDCYELELAGKSRISDNEVSITFRLRNATKGGEA